MADNNTTTNPVAATSAPLTKSPRQVAVSTETGEVGILDTRLTKTTAQVAGAAILGALTGFFAADALNVDMIRKRAKQDPKVQEALNAANKAIKDVKTAADKAQFGSVDSSSNGVQDLISYINTAEAKVDELQARVVELTAARDEAVTAKQQLDAQLQELENIKLELARARADLTEANERNRNLEITNRDNEAKVIAFRNAERQYYTYAKVANALGTSASTPPNVVSRAKKNALRDVVKRSTSMLTPEVVESQIVSEARRQIISRGRKVSKITFYKERSDRVAKLTLDDNSVINVNPGVGIALIYAHKGVFTKEAGTPDVGTFTQIEARSELDTRIPNNPRALGVANGVVESAVGRGAVTAIFWSLYSDYNNFVSANGADLSDMYAAAAIDDDFTDVRNSIAIIVAGASYAASAPVDISATISQVTEDISFARQASESFKSDLAGTEAVNKAIFKYTPYYTEAELKQTVPNEDTL